ncbi:MAG: c-type cytochrome biogenesis protein CcsB [Coriobacteriia bacterium]|nr:c-type cytochrome biogenesis protein CcsB [Coriobacteriia bacterium]
MNLEILLMWLAVTAYALSTIGLVIGAMFRLDKLVTVSLWMAVIGIVPQGVAIGLRWNEVGHGPYLGFYEVVSSYAFASVIALAIAAVVNPKLRLLGVVIMPLATLMLGGAMLAPKSPLEITAKLASWWLTIHVTFAKLSYASFIAAFAISLAFLLRERQKASEDGILSRLPSQSVLDDLSYRFIGVGFIFLSIMIVAGAIWANEAWGRYWAWDPIETWSLISWIVYAGYMHTRLTLGWRGRQSSWFAVLALPLMAFTLMGVPLVYQSIHGAYLTGY